MAHKANTISAWQSLKKHFNDANESAFLTMKSHIIIALLLASISISFADIPKAGDSAPSFEGIDQNGKTISLTGLLSHQKIVLLYFYPKDFTGGCTKEACGFRDRVADLQTNDVVVIGVSHDTADSHVKFAEKYNLNFSLLPDADGTIIKAYGVKMFALSLAKRVSFLIGKDGKIVHVTEAASPQTHFAEMQEAIVGLKNAAGK